jgi:hypothetical protein
LKWSICSRRKSFRANRCCPYARAWSYTWVR